MMGTSNLKQKRKNIFSPDHLLISNQDRGSIGGEEVANIDTAQGDSELKEGNM